MEKQELDRESRENVVKMVDSMLRKPSKETDPNPYTITGLSQESVEFTMNYPLPAFGMVDGMKYLINSDRRILRAAVIIERDHDGGEALKPGELENGSIVVSYALNLDGEGAPLHFVNFEVDVMQDMDNLENYTRTIEIMDKRLQRVLSGLEPSDEVI